MLILVCFLIAIGDHARSHIGGSPSQSTEDTFYDINANLVADDAFYDQYDAWNRLLRVSHLGGLEFNEDGSIDTNGGAPGTWIVEFVYDPLGRLISTRRDWGDGSGDFRQIEYYYDGVRRIAEVITDPIEIIAGGRAIEFTYATPDGNGNQTWTDREYVWSPFYVDDLVVQIDAEENPLYALQDANENVLGLVDEYGDVLSQYTLDPYGTVRVVEKLEPTHAVNRIGHQGLFGMRLSGAPTDKVFEPGEPIVYYMRNRILDADKGRPLQRDPNATALAVINALAFEGLALSPDLSDFDLQVHYGDGLNTHAYVGSNPLVRTDPSGGIVKSCG